MSNNTNQAASKSDRITSHDEKTLDFDRMTLRAIAEVYYIEGNEEYRKENFINAVHFYSEGLNVNCKDEELRAKLYSNRAEAHFSLGNYKYSLSDAKLATELQPSFLKAILIGANTCVRLNLFEDAIKWCDKGLAIDKENKTLLELGNVAVKTKTTPEEKTEGSLENEAEDHKLNWDEENKTDQECTCAYHNGMRYSNQGDYKAALKCFEVLLSSAKDAGDKKTEASAYANLGIVYRYLNHPIKAIEFFKLALIITKEIENKNMEGRAYFDLGNAYHSLRDFKTAIEYYQQAVSITKEVRNKDLEQKAYENLGDAHSSLGNFKKAIEYYQQGLSIVKQVGNKDLEGTTYKNLAYAHLLLSDFKKAIEHYQQALSIAKEVGNKGLEETACINLGSAHFSVSDFKKAIEYLQQALSIAKQVGNKDSEGMAYGNLGVAHFFLSDYEKAIEYYNQCLSVAKQMGNKASEGKAYINLGNAHSSLSDFKKAIEYYQQGLNIAKQVGNKDLGMAYMNLGIAYDSLSDFKKAIEYYQQGLSIAKQMRDKATEGAAYLNIGSAHSSLGDLKKACECYEQGLRIAKQVGIKDLEGKAYVNLGQAHSSLSDFKNAIEYHQQALSIAKQVGSEASEGKAYANLGCAHSSLSDFEKAIEYHQQGLSIAKKVGNKASEGVAYVHLGLDYYALGKYEEATENYQEALPIAKQIGDKILEAKAYSGLGLAYDCLASYEKAIEFHLKSLSIAEEVGHKHLEGTAYVNLGIIYQSLGDLKTAIEFYQGALNIFKQVGNKVAQAKTCANLARAYSAFDDVSVGEEFYKASVRLFNETRALLKSNDEWKINLRNEYDFMYRKLWFVQLQQNKTGEALCTAECGRAQALMDLMESEFGVKSAQPDSEDHISSISKYLTSMTLFLAEASNSINFWVLQEGQPCKFVQKEIGDNLESLTHKAYKHIGVFEKVMCENRSLDELVDDESEEVFERNPDGTELISEDEEGDPFKALFDVLIGPISNLIQGDEVIIVPDAALFLVPYAALEDQHSRYLSETLRIRLVPTLTSLRLFAECPEEYHSTSSALLVGDPWIESVRIDGKKFQQLPAAKQEVEMIGGILKIAPLTGKNATKAEVLSRLKSVALIHIAAHGRAETGEVVLSPDPSKSKTPKEEDFLMTMADVLSAKLRARLVVLSCCHSGRGKIKAEGVVGLARAFLGAGARSVIASLWAIDDKATLEFMRYFYEHLVEGQSTGKALNLAMKRMRESDDFSDVKYWAPFVLIGDDVILKFDEMSKAADV